MCACIYFRVCLFVFIYAICKDIDICGATRQVSQRRQCRVSHGNKRMYIHTHIYMYVCMRMYEVLDVCEVRDVCTHIDVFTYVCT